MALKCNSCGGMLVYKIDEKKLACKHCTSRVDVKKYNCNTEAEKGYTMDTYLCRNCGAELVAPEEQAVAYCVYCGGETTLAGKSDPTERPKDIIPFQLTKEQVVEQYQKHINGVCFLPKQMKAGEFMEEFRGIYMPYWGLKVQLPEEIMDLKGRKQYSDSRYTYTEDYDLQIGLEGEAPGGYFDASVAFDDTVAAEIAPFDKTKSEPYYSGYLAGFYADRVTSDKKNYEEIAKESASQYIEERIEKKTDGVKLVNDPIRSKMQLDEAGSTVSLFPVWFLTWRRRKRVAYSVMNGQTGKISVDLPVAYGRFFIYAAIFSLILFGILSIIPYYIPALQVAVVGGVLLYISSYALKSELKRIREIEKHYYDYGFVDRKHKKKLIPGKRSTGQRIANRFCLTIEIILWCFFFITPEVSEPGEVGFLFVLFFILQMIVSIKGIVCAAGIKNKFALVPLGMSIAIQLTGCILAGSSHPQDYWYYGIMILCLGGMILNCLTAIFYLNLMATRPVPNFFQREGANNGRD